MPSRQSSQPILVPLASIRVSRRKLDRLSRTKINRYCSDLENGDDFPPITLIDCGTFFTISDGRHRFAAHQLAGFGVITARIR
jgi:hypothetical protein